MSPMARFVKLVALSLAVVVLLLVVVVFALYLHGGLPLFIRLANRPVSEPTTEEYAVYSAFIDNLFSSDQPFRLDQEITPDSIVYIADETIRLYTSHPLPPLLGVDAFGPDQDFYQQNVRPWRLRPSFHTRMKWALVRPGAAGPFPENPAICGVLHFSRVGFDWRRRTAMLDYQYLCGLLCGQSGDEVLLQQKGKDWQVKSWGGAVVY